MREPLGESREYADYSLMPRFDPIRCRISSAILPNQAMLAFFLAELLGQAGISRKEWEKVSSQKDGRLA